MKKGNTANKENYSTSNQKPNSLFAFVFLSFILNVILVILLFKAYEVKNTSTNSAINSPTATNSADQISPQNFTITTSDHIRGNANAKVTLVEFSDFECPYCGRFYLTAKQILNDFDGKVRLVYKHFPLSIHQNSQKAAEASECANDQGKFWEYHDKLFDSQSDGFSTDKFKTWAQDLGLNAQNFNNCLDSGKYYQKVQKDLEEGNKIGISGTPTTFVNGQPEVGAVSYDELKQKINSLL